MGFMKSPTLLPARFRGSMVYNTVVSLSVPASSVATNVFRVNSVFDPDYTGVGTSVAGYSQLAALYGRYRVLGAKFEIAWTTTGSTTWTGFVCANPVNTVGTSLPQILAQRFVWFKSAGASTGSATISHSGSVSIAKTYGVPEVQVETEDDYAGLVGGNPNNQVFLHVGAYGDGGATGLFAHVRIVYDVIWSLPLELV